MTMARRYSPALLMLLAAPVLVRADGPDAAALEFFEKQVRPVLIDNCYRCHSDAKDKPKGKLRVDSRAAILRGGDNGPAAVPGKPAESLLIKAIEHKIDKLKMPRDGKLKDSEIAVLNKWVEMGLPWPNSENDKPIIIKKFEITEEQRTFWSFQPVKVVPPPDVKDKAWAKSEIDRYLLAAMEAKGLKPAPPADGR